LIPKISAECNCGEIGGFHCGLRSSDGSYSLNGNCDPNIIYECPAANIPAKVISHCSSCIKGVIMGTDSCGFEKEGISIYILNFN
jgi:hypothetical protein